MPLTSSQATGSLDTIGQQDHQVTSEYRIFGPPGTGKTTNVTRQIRRAVDRYGPEGVLVTSFSRAAATELAGRDLPIAGDRVGTDRKSTRLNSSHQSSSRMPSSA